MFHATLDVLLYAGPGVWVVRPRFLIPTRTIEVGFAFMPRDHPVKDAATPD
jgi:hypothetical protein